MSKTPMVATENLYRTADGEIVREGDKRAAFHVVRAGSQVPDEWVKAVKDFLGDQPDEEPEPEPTTAEPEAGPEPEPEAKQAAKAEDKAVRKTANKAKSAAKK